MGPKRPKTLRITPAMAAGVTDRLWRIADIVSRDAAASTLAAATDRVNSKRHRQVGARDAMPRPNPGPENISL